jgi:hypothetical protein
MKKIWIVGTLLAAAACLLLAETTDPDIFDTATFTVIAVPSHGSLPKTAAGVTSYTGDLNANPQLVFNPGQTVVWWSTPFVVFQGQGTQTQSISIAASTPKSTKNLGPVTFQICNTDTNSCPGDDVPAFTSWTLGVFINLPSFLEKILLKTGPVPFNSVVTGTGYVPFSNSLTGNSVAPF